MPLATQSFGPSIPGGGSGTRLPTSNSYAQSVYRDPYVSPPPGSGRPFIYPNQTGWDSQGKPLYSGYGTPSSSTPGSAQANLPTMGAWTWTQSAAPTATYNGILADLEAQTALGGRSNSISRGLLESGANADLARLMEEKYRNVDLGQHNLGIRGQYADQLLALAGKQLGLAGQTRDTGLGQAQLTFDIGHRNLVSDARSRGALDAAGTFSGADELARQLGLTQQGVQTAYGGAQLDYERAQAAGQKEKAQITADKAALDSLARDYGTTRAEIEYGLKAGLDRLGIDYDQFLAQMRAARGTADQNYAGQLQMIASQAISMAGSGQVRANPPPAAIAAGPARATATNAGPRVAF